MSLNFEPIIVLFIFSLIVSTITLAVAERVILSKQSTRTKFVTWVITALIANGITIIFQIIFETAVVAGLSENVIEHKVYDNRVIFGFIIALITFLVFTSTITLFRKIEARTSALLAAPFSVIHFILVVVVYSSRQALFYVGEHMSAKDIYELF